MMSKKSPQLRFEGFTDDWEQRKLKDIFDVHTDFVSNGSFQALKENVQLYKTENYAYMIRLQDASNNWDGPWLYTDKQGFDFLDKSTVYKDDILMSDRGTIGKFFLVPQLDKPMTLSSNAVLLRSTKNDNNFIYYMLNTSNISNQIIVRTTPGVQPMISKTEFKKINTCIPNIEEQQKIGSFFQQLDETIALHQRKLDLLKEQKKGYLQKMFPKNGEKVPELRFKGFTDAWEQRKLNEVSDIYDGTHQTPKYQDDGVMFLSVENIKTLTSNKFISREAFEDEFKIRPQRGDVLMTRIGDIGTANVVETDEDLAYYVSLALFKSEELNPYFLQASIYAPFVQDQIWKRTLHIAFPKKINKNAIGQVPINVPTLAEQTKIGSFFKQLDDTITLHQRKLDLLKEQKKGYLQKMFV
ncbi:restriction endonuclease subunit S [Lactococcus lactis]|uniref:restriction endonuclease subunit S n=1 Tax=Lactococcus lactis TaxID=1358 RepID=UPI0035CF3114|nr:restriction endonuclease subunit S [Lactococcus lactis]